MKTWFRIAITGNVPAFVAVKRDDIREFLARALKPVEVAKIPEAERNDDTLYLAYCQALAAGDSLIDEGEKKGELDVGEFKFRFIAL